MPKIDSRKDILLLLLFAPGESGNYAEPIVGRTRLVKMLFIFQKEVLSDFKRGTDISDANFYQFFPWNFGPFSVEVYDDLTFFQLRGFVESGASSEDTISESADETFFVTSQIDPEFDGSEDEVFVEESFSLTLKGQTFCEQMWNQLSEPQHQLLSKFKAKFASAPLRTILRYVYEQYGEMTTKSTIKDTVLNGR